jgi:hypothetical protein
MLGNYRVAAQLVASRVVCLCVCLFVCSVIFTECVEIPKACLDTR